MRIILTVGLRPLPSVVFNPPAPFFHYVEYLCYMKVLITESQYGALIELIQKHKRDIDFLITNLRYSVEKDVIEHLTKTFNAKQRHNNAPGYYYYVIVPEHISNKFMGNQDINPSLFIQIIFGKDNVFVNVSYTGINGNFTNIDNYVADTNSYIRWKFVDNENGEEEFYSKLDKVINKKISIPYQNKLIEKIEASMSKPRKKTRRLDN